MRPTIIVILASTLLTAGFADDETLLIAIKKSASDPQFAMETEKELTLRKTPIGAFLRVIEADGLEQREQAIALNLAMRVRVNNATADEVNESEKIILLRLARNENIRVANSAIDLLSACLGVKAFPDILILAQETKSVRIAQSCATSLALISHGQENWVGTLIDSCNDYPKCAAVIAGLSQAPVARCIKELTEYAIQTEKTDLRETIKSELNRYRESEAFGPIVEPLFTTAGNSR